MVRVPVYWRYPQEDGERWDCIKRESLRLASRVLRKMLREHKDIREDIFNGGCFVVL